MSFLSACVPGTVPGSQHTVVSEVDAALSLTEFICQWRKQRRNKEQKQTKQKTTPIN